MIGCVTRKVHFLVVSRPHSDAMMKAYVEEMVIVADSQEIARHRRSYETGDFFFNPLHYLVVLERKVGGSALAGLGVAPVAGSPAQPQEPPCSRQAGIRTGLA